MKHTITGFVTLRPCNIEDASLVEFWPFDPRKYKHMAEYVVVKEHSFEVEVPDDFDPRPEMIKALQAKQQKARADFEKLCTDIQRQISEWQALEFNGDK